MPTSLEEHKSSDAVCFCRGDEGRLAAAGGLLLRDVAVNQEEQDAARELIAATAPRAG